MNRACACALLWVVASSGLPPTWTHAWDTALQSQFIDFGYSYLNSIQASFVSSHYAIVSIEKCTGSPNTERGIWTTAAQLKALNPDVRVLFYIHAELVSLGCYAAYTAWMSLPQYWLRNDAGQTVFNENGVPVLNYSDPGARAWFVSIPLNGTGSPAAAIVDGVFIDFTGFTRCPGIAASRCAALKEGKRAMVREMQALLDATNGGSVFQNPPKDFEALETLSDANAVMGEHFAAFEQVVQTGPTTWRFDAAKISAYFDAVATAAAAGKAVVVATWPGPLSGPFVAGSPSWIDGSHPKTIGGWKEPIAEWHAFALAGFLTCAQENVWMQYQMWYNGFTQGAIYCGSSLSCAAPSVWYPDLFKPLGRPLGPAVRTGNRWTRRFEHAVSVFDVDNPFRNVTNVTFFSPSPTATLSATPDGTRTSTATASASSPITASASASLSAGSSVAAQSSSRSAPPAARISPTDNATALLSPRNETAGALTDSAAAANSAGAAGGVNVTAIAVVVPLAGAAALAAALLVYLRRHRAARQRRRLNASVPRASVRQTFSPLDECSPASGSVSSTGAP